MKKCKAITADQITEEGFYWIGYPGIQDEKQWDLLFIAKDKYSGELMRYALPRPGGFPLAKGSLYIGPVKAPTNVVFPLSTIPNPILVKSVPSLVGGMAREAVRKIKTLIPALTLAKKHCTPVAPARKVTSLNPPLVPVARRSGPVRTEVRIEG